ncbi:MAG: STAS domain-containing protein [Clostridia bacterium]|nr:STAS domain-containing protein [Clostridia bacterium]
MQIQYDRQSRTLKVTLSGEIDHHSALDTRMEIDSQIKQLRPKKLVLDYSEVTFMDSSGIGLIMGRHRLMQSMDGVIEVKNVPDRLYKVVKLAGIEKLGKVSAKTEVKK